MQTLSRGLTEQGLRIKSMKLENKQLRHQLADQAALWTKLQHDLLLLNGIPEGKGRRQQVPPLCALLCRAVQYCAVPSAEMTEQADPLWHGAA